MSGLSEAHYLSVASFPFVVLPQDSLPRVALVCSKAGETGEIRPTRVNIDR